MQQRGNQRTSAPEHLYRYTPRSLRVRISWIIACPIGLGAIFVVNGLLPPHHFGLDPFVAVCALIGMSVGLTLMARRTTLTVTPDGVGYRRSYRDTWVLWQDIEAIRPWSRGYYGWTVGEGLVIRANALSLPGSRPRRTFSRYFIPLECFAPRWRESPLGEDVRRYAPWLMSGEETSHR